ncbi:MAG: transglycosylase SLT domain-containing protein [Campylobacterota bacterium]
MKVIILFLSLFSMSFGFIETRTNISKAEVLDSLDIERSFINTQLYKDFENPSKLANQKTFFAAMNRGFAYVPKVRQKIQDAGIPESFLYMAMAESGFSLKAFSHASASGLWQFMPYTAQKFGLRIDRYVDERRDPVKSTQAAIAYLQYLHNRFGKWYLAALAYNGGEGRVSRAIKRAGSDKLEVLIDEKKKYLPRETRNYIKKIVQFTLIAQNKELMLNSNFDYLLNRGEAYSLAKVSVPGGESIERISQIIRVDALQLQTYNPHLKHGITPPDSKRYDIYIPYMNLIDFKAYYNSDDLKNFYVMHEVTSGETLGAISRRYKVNTDLVMEFNNINSHIIHPQQKLIIPVAKNEYQRLNPRVYEVQSGDTLSKIARKFKTTINKLKQINNKNNSIVYIGEQLVVAN